MSSEQSIDQIMLVLVRVIFRFEVDQGPNAE